MKDTSISSRDADDDCRKTVLDTDTLTARLQGPFGTAVVLIAISMLCDAWYGYSCDIDIM